MSQMTRDEAIAFLKANQPMPDDQNITNETGETYMEVLEYFMKNKDVECIPLFLNSLGDGCGLGVYQHVEDVYLQFDKAEVLPHLLEALNSECDGTVFWACHAAAAVPDPSLIPALKTVLKSDNADLRIFSTIALEQIGGNEVIYTLIESRIVESNSDVLEVFDDVLADLLKQ